MEEGRASLCELLHRAIYAPGPKSVALTGFHDDQLALMMALVSHAHVTVHVAPVTAMINDECIITMPGVPTEGCALFARTMANYPGMGLRAFDAHTPGVAMLTDDAVFRTPTFNAVVTTAALLIMRTGAVAPILPGAALTVAYAANVFADVLPWVPTEPPASAAYFNAIFTSVRLKMMQKRSLHAVLADANLLRCRFTGRAIVAADPPFTMRNAIRRTLTGKRHRERIGEPAVIMVVGGLGRTTYNLAVVAPSAKPHTAWRFFNRLHRPRRSVEYV